MIPKNNALNFLLAIALLVIVFQAGCTTTTVNETPLAPTEAVETTQPIAAIVAGTGLAEITDSNQIPAFKDDF
ncbi:MAG TPA: hypothetical protein QF423_04400, partial [Candidatus Scalindua sp.]|nr:hypothetical protein [Candidatus Scalindua sp.]